MTDDVGAQNLLNVLLQMNLTIEALAPLRKRYKKFPLKTIGPCDPSRDNGIIP